MAHIIVTGATGLAGSAILAASLASPAVARVSVLSRRPVKLAEDSPKARVIIHSDYASFPSSVLDELRGATGCIWAQGKSSVGMQEADYTVLTRDWPIAFATAIAGLTGTQAKTNFVYISGEGADPSEKAGQMFARIKGRAEKDLLALAENTPTLAVYNLRPGMIDPMGERASDRAPSFARDMAERVFGPLSRVLYPSMHTPTAKLAQVSLELVTGDGGPIADGEGVQADGRTLRNVAIRRLAGL